jgi:hypothetical protein
MLIVFAVVLIVFALAVTLLIRPSAIPEPEAPSPTQHLEDKKATIYENLRDLQGEYRMGKLSDEDYKLIKLELQRELAGVLAEIDRIEKPGAVAEPPEPGSSAAVARGDTAAQGDA